MAAFLYYPISFKKQCLGNYKVTDNDSDALKPLGVFKPSEIIIYTDLLPKTTPPQVMT